MKLIKNANDKQKYYQLDFKVTKYALGSSIYSIESLWKNDPIKLKEEYEIAEDISISIDKICISDAHTHYERLVFPAFNIRNKETGEITLCHRNNTIAGSTTFLIYGGDIESMLPHEEYVKQLRKINEDSNA